MQFPQIDAIYPGKMTTIDHVGEGLSTETLVAIPSVLSWEPYNPVCMTPVTSNLSSLCQQSADEWLCQNFVY